MSETSDLHEQRKAKLEELRAAGINPYPSRYEVSHTIGALTMKYANLPGEELQHLREPFSIAGRLMAKRLMGKTLFGHLRDRTGSLQVYARHDTLGGDLFQRVRRFDVGDFLGCAGTLFKTRTGELTLAVERSATRASPCRTHKSSGTTG